MTRYPIVGVACCYLVGFALLYAVDTYAAKPPERVDQINCSVFEAIPILEEVRPFLDDVQAPDNIDFKTRVAYVDDWTKRRAVAAVRLDKLIEVCRSKMKEGGD